ncbi:hypothetical protein ACHAXT_009121 [Thalassiosira profunda]
MPKPPGPTRRAAGLTEGCADEHETGVKTTAPHVANCPRSRGPDKGAAHGGDAEKDAVDAGEGEKCDADAKSPDGAPLRVGNIIDVPVSNLRAHLICSLCKGYFRDPHTVADCLHTFCRSCLILFLWKEKRCCPTCNGRLGPDPFNPSTTGECAREIVPDHTLRDIVNKIFPEMKAQEDEEERTFYSQRGIELKPEYLQEERARKRAGRKYHHSPTKKMNDAMDVRLEPDSHPPHSHQKMMPLREPHLLLTGSAKISTLKKYLVQKLGLKDTKGSIEILCNGDPVGNELSLTFIFRTRWLFAPKEEVFTLNYRLEEEGHA